MTDRYCIAKFTELTVPEESRVLMALISADSLERVKQAADIVEVSPPTPTCAARAPAGSASARSTRSARPRSRSTPQEKLYHCFGCGVGGDVIKFVEEKEGLGFAEAVELLADRYGVELRARAGGPAGGGAAPAAPPRSSELLDRTAAFYASYLWESEEAGKARDYLAERGLGEEVLRAFGVGYAPSAWDKVLRARPAGRLQGRGAARRRARAAGPQRRRVRPLPRADHVPDPRPPRPRARLRRPGDALRPGRQVRQHGRDRLLPQEPDALRRSTGPRRRSPRRAARSSSRATPTCSPCTRRGSRRRSG